MSSDRPTRIGVLALQGSFAEHVTMLKRVDGVQAFEVRTKEELQSADGLIIPGGESTTMALVAERWGLIPELKQFSAQHRPVWGTCAGAIFLADKATGTKSGGQALLGGLDCTVHRNFFGAQIRSFVTKLKAPACMKDFGAELEDFRAVFIRAPGVIDAGPSVEILAEYHLSPDEQKTQDGRESVAVAVRDQHLLATAFHPELTSDLRWHQLFVQMVREQQSQVHCDGSMQRDSELTESGHLIRRSKPAELPCYDEGGSASEWRH